MLSNLTDLMDFSILDCPFKNILTFKVRREVDKTLKNNLIYRLRKKEDNIPKVFIHVKRKKRIYPFGMERL